MKLLYTKASNFKKLKNDCVLNFIARSKKTAVDKEYELQEIAPGLFVSNVVAFIGKNASGKTTLTELLDCCYSILSNFSLVDKYGYYAGVKLTMCFYHEGRIYKYYTELASSPTMDGKVSFVNQKLSYKEYNKYNIKGLFDDNFTDFTNISILPEDISILFFVLKDKATRAIYMDCYGDGPETYRLAFNAIKQFKITPVMLSKVLKLFDSNITGLEMLDDSRYRLKLKDKDMVLSEDDLYHFLSGGTTKGILLYISVIASLKNGFDIIIDEIENHFHRTLVENLICLYKDKMVNTHNATLFFSTHQCEVLDMFNRQDNIWVCRADDEVTVDNMYDAFNIRSELSKSKQFYNNTFKTAVNYDDLMGIKIEIIS
ncbi:MAG: ATP-binding protein [Clostridia bacterium]|nr:ATP-binding protein [Clostridia bacterium]